MSEQPLLFKMPPRPVSARMPKRPVPENSLFLALLPDRDTARNIADLGKALRRKHSIHGIVRPVTHLHVSLRGLGSTVEVPKIVAGSVVDQICKAVAKITPPFEIRFNRVMRFGNSPGNRPLVLVNDNDESDGVQRLHELLYVEFAKYNNSTRAIPKFEPHVTLLYDKQAFASEAIEPICWTAGEIILVCSEVGATKYHRVATWPLGQ